MKKRMTALLSVVLLLCSLLAVSVSAATKESTTNRSLKVTAKCSLPSTTIQVVLPASTKTYVNPSGVTVKLAGTVTNAQIVGDTGYIENQTETPITVSVKVTGSKTSGSGVVFKTASTSGSSSTAKDVFAYFQMQAVSDPDSMSWDSSDANNSVVVSTTAKSVTDMVTLAKYDEDNVDTSANRYAAFKVDGDCVMFPDSDWTSKDGFTVQVVFTFKALPYDYEVD